MKTSFTILALIGIFLIVDSTDREIAASRSYNNSPTERRIHNKTVAWWFAVIGFEVAMILGVALS